MIKYQLVLNPMGTQSNAVNKFVDNKQVLSVPFDPANTDYQNFKKDVLAGAEMQDDTGNVMTQADAFVGTLP
jgi:hypothetical protein